MLIHGTAFWGFGLLPGWLLANFAALKIFGFWTALIFSLACAAVLLLWLLEKHSKAVLLDKDCRKWTLLQNADLRPSTPSASPPAPVISPNSPMPRGCPICVPCRF